MRYIWNVLCAISLSFLSPIAGHADSQREGSADDAAKLTRSSAGRFSNPTSLHELFLVLSNHKHGDLADFLRQKTKGREKNTFTIEKSASSEQWILVMERRRVPFSPLRSENGRVISTLNARTIEVPHPVSYEGFWQNVIAALPTDRAAGIDWILPDAHAAVGAAIGIAAAIAGFLLIANDSDVCLNYKQFETLCRSKKISRGKLLEAAVRLDFESALVSKLALTCEAPKRAVRNCIKSEISAVPKERFSAEVFAHYLGHPNPRSPEESTAKPSGVDN